MICTEDLKRDTGPEFEKRLTKRQRQVLVEYVKHGSRKQAAVNLGITVDTTKRHLASTYTRLEAYGLIEALWRLGWLTVPDIESPELDPSKTSPNERSNIQ